MAKKSIEFVPAYDSNALAKMMEDTLMEVIEQTTIKILTAAGEYFVGEARRGGAYKDRTGNLRSSIGYVVLKDGEKVSQSEFVPIGKMYAVGMSEERYEKAIIESDGTEGVDVGRRLIEEMTKEYPFGLVLVGVAAMEYALYVEAIHSLDVITGATIKTMEFIRDSFEAVTAKMG